jgi:hypothetical protein
MLPVAGCAGFFDILNGLMLEDFLVSEMSTTYEKI